MTYFVISSEYFLIKYHVLFPFHRAVLLYFFLFLEAVVRE